MVVGITGGIACGKTLAGDFLEELGVLVLDADEVAHFVSKYETETVEAVLKAFGKEVFSPYGMLNRAALARIVFSSPAERGKLERILHPRIKEILRVSIEHARNRNASMALIAPLLIESNFQDMVDVIWVVSSEARLQVDRLKKKYSTNEIEAYRRINAQLPLREKEAYANYVLHNNGSIEEFKALVAQTWKKTLKEHGDK
jgi:dephospho-CoA kinase